MRKGVRFCSFFLVFDQNFWSNYLIESVYFDEHRDVLLMVCITRIIVACQMCHNRKLIEAFLFFFVFLRYRDGFLKMSRSSKIAFYEFIYK